MIGSKLGIYSQQNLGGSALLLDDYPATAAYSLRKLRTAYTGAAIEIRVDTTGQPTYNIGFDASGELDTADLLAKAGANDAYVSIWYDQQGSDNAINASAAQQPQIVSLGSVINQGSLPTLDFAGAQQLIKSSTALSDISLFTEIGRAHV